MARLSPYTQLEGDATVIPVLRRKTIRNRVWLLIRLAGRPNGRRAWIAGDDVTLVPLRWHITVVLHSRVMVITRDFKRVHRIHVVVGAPITPTPTGHFYVVESGNLRTNWSWAGRYLALSAFSNVLKHFDGGEGQVAIHARGSLVGPLGSASSHGCVRVDDSQALWLSHRIPNGTPVDILR